MVGDGRCCKLFVFRGDRRSAIGIWGYTPVRTTGVLVYLCINWQNSIAALYHHLLSGATILLIEQCINPYYNSAKVHTTGRVAVMLINIGDAMLVCIE